MWKHISWLLFYMKVLKVCLHFLIKPSLRAKLVLNFTFLKQAMQLILINRHKNSGNLLEDNKVVYKIKGKLK